MKNIKKIFLSLLVLVSLFTITNVKAEDYLYADDNVVINNPAKHTIFGAGNNVTLNSDIDGITFLAGNIVTVNKEAEYLFVGGNSVTVNAGVTKDLFIGANTIMVNGDVGRDAYIAGNTITVAGKVKGNLFVGGNVVILSDVEVEGDVISSGVNIILGEKTKITGKFVYDEDSIVSGKEMATVGSFEEHKYAPAITYDKSLTIKAKVISEVTSLVMNIACLIVLLLVFPKLYNFVNKKRDLSEVAKSMLSGFGFLVLVPVVCILAMLLIVLMPLCGVGLLVYVASIIIGILLGIVFIGNAVVTRLFNVKDSMLLSVFVGSALFTLVGLIPVVGELYVFINLLIGLGLIVQLFKNLKDYSHK